MEAFLEPVSNVVIVLLVLFLPPALVASSASRCGRKSACSLERRSALQVKVGLEVLDHRVGVTPRL